MVLADGLTDFHTLKSAESVNLNMSMSDDFMYGSQHWHVRKGENRHILRSEAAVACKGYHDHIASTRIR